MQLKIGHVIFSKSLKIRLSCDIKSGVSIVVECSQKMVRTESLPSTQHFREKVWEERLGTAGV